jgi:hypothetical protein
MQGVRVRVRARVRVKICKICYERELKIKDQTSRKGEYAVQQTDECGLHVKVRKARYDRADTRIQTKWYSLDPIESELRHRPSDHTQTAGKGRSR